MSGESCACDCWCANPRLEPLVKGKSELGCERHGECSQRRAWVLEYREEQLEKKVISPTVTGTTRFRYENSIVSEGFRMFESRRFPLEKTCFYHLYDA